MPSARSALLSGAAAVALLPVAASAAITVTPAKDVWVRADQPTAQPTQGTTLDVRDLTDPATGAGTSSGWRKAWLGFDLGAVPAAGVDGATLRVVIGDAPSNQEFSPNPVNVWGLTDNALDGWSAGAVTWNNAPGNNTASGSEVDTSKAVLLGSATYTPVSGGAQVGAVYTFTLDPSFFNTTGDVATLILTAGANSGVPTFRFYSMEATTEALRPTLTLTPVPEPAALTALAGAGLLALSRRRRP